jgi:hypothetical protein
MRTVHFVVFQSVWCDFCCRRSPKRVSRALLRRLHQPISLLQRQSRRLPSVRWQKCWSSRWRSRRCVVLCLISSVTDHRGPVFVQLSVPDQDRVRGRGRCPVAIRMTTPERNRRSRYCLMSMPSDSDVRTGTDRIREARRHLSGECDNRRTGRAWGRK